MSGNTFKAGDLVKFKITAQYRQENRTHYWLYRLNKLKTLTYYDNDQFDVKIDAQLVYIGKYNASELWGIFLTNGLLGFAQTKYFVKTKT